MSEEFKEKWEKYKAGILPEEESSKFEAELERLEAYQQIIEEEDNKPGSIKLNSEAERRILKNG